jgi:regulation of enolase protein 1 (concanavalin A-like superfamily)
MKRMLRNSAACLIAIIAPVTIVYSQTKDSVSISSIPYKLFWENTPVGFQNNQSSFTIIGGAKTDMFRDPNVTYNTDNAPKLVFIPDSNFVLTCSIHHAFTSQWDGGAIVLKADNLHWVKFCFEKDYTGTHRVVSVVTNDISDDCNSLPITTNQVYYKIAKADNVITLYYSPDGTKWFLIRHFQFNASGPLKLGFLAQSPTGKSCKVTFANVTYEPKKIKDPYLGE